MTQALSHLIKNLVKRKFPYIGTFDHEGLAVVIVMHDLTAWVF